LPEYSVFKDTVTVNVCDAVMHINGAGLGYDADDDSSWWEDDDVAAVASTAPCRIRARGYDSDATGSGEIHIELVNEEGGGEFGRWV